MTSEWQRAIQFPAVSNFRDFGGYPTSDGRTVPTGLLFRSAHLGRIDESGFAQLNALGIKTVVDLRGKEERTKALPKAADVSTLDYVSAPVEPGALKSMIMPDGRTVTPELMRDNIIKTYRRFGGEPSIGFGVALARILEAAEAPLLVHCTAGKDRTGFTVAIVQLLLGVSMVDVVDDYLLTNLHWDRAYDGASRFPPEVMEPGLQAHEDYLGAALALVETEHGGVEGFAEKATGIVDFGRKLRAKILGAR